MRKRKHGLKTMNVKKASRPIARGPMQRRKRLTGIGLVLGVLMALSIVGAAYTNRASDPFANRRAPKAPPTAPVTPAKH